MEENLPMEVSVALHPFGIFNVHFNVMLQKSDVSLFPALLNTCYIFNELTFFYLEKPSGGRNETETKLTFTLQIPSRNFT
jgi:hypothetical protein